MFLTTTRIACVLFAIGVAGGVQAKDIDPPQQDPPKAVDRGDTERATGKSQQPLPPLVRFWRSNAGWSAHFSFADPVTEIQWSVKEDGPFESTGFLPSYDPRTRRRMANPSIQVPSDASVIHVRYADIDGNWVGPFAIPFDPDVEIVRFYRSILETTAESWLAFRRGVPNILYYTHVAGYRCAIREFRIGVGTTTPDRVIKLAPCDMRDPVSNPPDVDTHLWIDPAVDVASAQIVYKDGTVSKVQVFRR
jgi:hypothetical protein